MARGRTVPFLRWAQYPLMIIGVVLLGYCAAVYVRARLYQAEEGRRFEEARKVAPGEPSVPARRRPPPEPGATIGRLEIPRVSITAMVREGEDARTLSKAVGHVPGTALPGEPGNVVVAGHRDTFFRGLRNVRKDDTIILKTLGGDHRYAVESTSIVAPTYTQPLDPTVSPTLTLITCYPFYYVGKAPKRFIVRAREMEDVAQQQRPPQQVAGLSPVRPAVAAVRRRPATANRSVARTVAAQTASAPPVAAQTPERSRPSRVRRALGFFPNLGKKAFVALRRDQ